MASDVQKWWSAKITYPFTTSLPEQFFSETSKQYNEVEEKIEIYRHKEFIESYELLYSVLKIIKPQDYILCMNNLILWNFRIDYCYSVLLGIVHIISEHEMKNHLYCNMGCTQGS